MQNINWDDDEIFDELLAAVPSAKTATDVHTPFKCMRIAMQIIIQINM